MFEHKSCLDIEIRDRPQPETLYEDKASSASLVIERKNLLWPADYAKRHDADHRLIDAIQDRLSDETKDLPYAVTVPGGEFMSDGDLDAFASTIADAAIPMIGRLAEGQGVGSNFCGRKFSFRLQHQLERDEWEPQVGLMIEMLQSPNPNISYEDLLVELHSQIEKCFHGCVKSFSEYVDARRILLIDAFGDLRYQDAEWWEGLFSAMPPPSAVPEIWLGMQDWVTNTDTDWKFQRVYVSNG